MYRTIVTFEMREESIPAFKTVLEKSTPLTLAEKGCLSAGMYQDVNDPTHFRCIEDWETYEDMMAHVNNPEKPAPDNAFYYIQDNMVGKDQFNFYSDFCVMNAEK